MNSYDIFIYEFMYMDHAYGWIHSWIHMYMNSYIWIMNSWLCPLISFMNSYNLWIQIWMLGYVVPRYPMVFQLQGPLQLQLGQPEGRLGPVGQGLALAQWHLQPVVAESFSIGQADFQWPCYWQCPWPWQHKIWTPNKFPSPTRFRVRVSSSESD